MSEGIHPFPSRTRQLSPPEPMVLGAKAPGRVGRRQNNFKDTSIYGVSFVILLCEDAGGFLFYLTSNFPHLTSQTTRFTANREAFLINVYMKYFVITSYNIENTSLPVETGMAFPTSDF